MKPGRRAGPVTGELEEQALSEVPLGFLHVFRLCFVIFLLRIKKASAAETIHTGRILISFGRTICLSDAVLGGIHIGNLYTHTCIISVEDRIVYVHV